MNDKLQTFLELMNSLDNDELVLALETELKFTKKELEKISVIIEEIEEYEEIITKDKSIYKSTDKGSLLEALAAELFREKHFYIKENLRSTSNELDLVLVLKNKSITLMRLDKILNINSNNFIIECKNYNKNVDVTWTSKFAFLVDHHKSDLGIIVSRLPITGLNDGKTTWNAAAGLTKKFYLNKNRKIINITLDDIKNNIIDGNYSIYDLIKEKIACLQLDADFKLEKHEILI